MGFHVTLYLVLLKDHFSTLEHSDTNLVSLQDRAFIVVCLYSLSVWSRTVDAS